MELVRPKWKSNFESLLLLAPLLLIVLLVFSSGAAGASAPEDDGNITVYRAEDHEVASADALESAIENRTIVPSEEFVIGDRIVVRIRSDRLSDSMAAGNGSATDRFFEALNGSAQFRLIQTNPTPQRSRKIGSIGRRNVTVYHTEPTTYVLVDTRTLAFQYRGVNRSTEIFGDERFVVQFGYNLTGVTDRSDDTSSREFGLHPFKSELYTKGYTYTPLPPEWVEFSVRVEELPEDVVSIRIAFDNDRTITKSVDVGEHPGFRHVHLDLRDITPGTEYVLELVHDGEVTDRYEGTVTVPQAVIANATLANVGTDLRVTRSGNRVTKHIDDHTAVKAAVELSHGGKVQVLNANCDQVGYAWIEPGAETRATMKLWKEGKPLRGLNHSEYGVFIRSLRDPGSSKSVYRRGRPEAKINIDGTCVEPTSSPTPTPESTTVSTVGNSSNAATPSAATPQTRTPAVATEPPNQPANTETATPGQPGFTVLTLLGSTSLLILLRRR